VYISKKFNKMKEIILHNIAEIGALTLIYFTYKIMKLIVKEIQKLTDKDEPKKK
jgi:hypothetical protein